MDLTGTQIKNTYGNVLTIGSTAGTPTTGTLQNGAGQDVTALTLTGLATITGSSGYLLRMYGGGQSYLPNLGIIANLGFGPAFTSDTFLTRDGVSNTLAQRNSTNAQTFNLYNTYTDGSNYERGFLKWNSNVLTIGAEALGTGTLRGVKLGTASTSLIGFYDATAIVQPTTGVAEAAFVENSGGTAVNVDSTFGGYTIQQIAQALQSLGLLA